MFDLSKSVLAGKIQPLYGAPCEITQLSPLLITLGDELGVEAEKIAGATYSLGDDAFAIFTSPGIPIVLPLT